MKIDEYEVAEGLCYSTDHAWIKVEDGKARIGISDYAQKQLKQILVIDLPEIGSKTTQTEPYASIESIKLVTDLISPLSGTVVEINSELQSNPTLINEDPFGKGWLLILEPSNLDKELPNLMDFQKAVEWYKELIKKSS